ncbi:MAG TPA: hypothetical protein VFV49_07660 [Thermoanaerobaculia bacterium]|nr:hypothetical protein [Thermoanaerobaculia bacterium]
MNQLRFEAEIAFADTALADVVRERVYDGVHVSVDWPADLAAPTVRVAVEVRGDLEPRDAPAYVELFFHDLFLLLNLASPGSFGGTISFRGGELRVRELTFSPRVFAYAAPLATLPLADVVGWYDALKVGTQQVATSGVTTALFRLLQLARGEENDELSVLALASAAEALFGRTDSLRRLFELRDEIARGRTPVFHPMHDDALDPRVEDATREWIEVADEAAGLVICNLQGRIRR